MTKRACWNFTILSLMLAVLAWGQSETISFGGAELRLGMPRDEVKAKLSESNHFMDGESQRKALGDIPKDTVESFEKQYGKLRSGSDDTVYVARKLDFRLVGSVHFSGGNLVQVSKSWTPDSGETTAFFRALYTLVSNLNQQGHLMAAVKTLRVGTPEVTAETVALYFGPSRAVMISFEVGETLGIKIRGISLSEEYYQAAPSQPTTKRKAMKAETR